MASTWRPERWGRRLAVVLGTPSLAWLAGCASNLPQNTFDPKGPVARMQLDLLSLTLWFAIGIFVVVGGALLYILIRFRERPGQGRPAQVHGHTGLEIAWTIAPVLILTIVAVPTIRTAFQVAAPPAPPALRVKVVANQWWWAFEYPEQGFVTANELHIPVNKPVQLTLESNDVIHSFWVPKLGGKTDLIPGRTNTMWLLAEEPDTYYGQCAELCGSSHAKMRFRVVAQTPQDFEAWVASRKRPVGVAQLSGKAKEGWDLFNQKGCIACHTIDGTTAQGKVGPNLTGVGGRGTIAAGVLENTEANLAAWLRNPQAIKPSTKMPNLNLNEGEIASLVAFLRSQK